MQRQRADILSRSRSKSVDKDGKGHWLYEDVHMAESQGRRALYGSLPMVSAFGMHNTESSVRKAIVSASYNALETLAPDESKVIVRTIARSHSPASF